MPHYFKEWQSVSKLTAMSTVPPRDFDTCIRSRGKRCQEVAVTDFSILHLLKPQFFCIHSMMYFSEKSLRVDFMTFLSIYVIYLNLA